MDKFNKRLEYFKELFGLKNWDILVKLSPTVDQNHSAMTLADPRYHHADMTVYPQVLANEGAFDAIIVHELIHIVMAMYDYFADNLGKKGTDELFFIAREKSVSELTHIFMRILYEHYPEMGYYKDGDK